MWGRRKIGEEGKYDTLEIVLYQGLHLVARHSHERQGNGRRKTQKQRWKNYKNGRERPHFFGFQPPKNTVGSLPPFDTNFRA